MKRAELVVGESYVDTYGTVHVVIAHGYGYDYRRNLRKGEGQRALVLRHHWNHDRDSRASNADVKLWAVGASVKLDQLDNPAIEKIVPPQGWSIVAVGPGALHETQAAYDERKARARVEREARDAAEVERHARAAAQQALFVASLEALGLSADTVSVVASSTRDHLTVKIDAEVFSALLGRAT